MGTFFHKEPFYLTKDQDRVFLTLLYNGSPYEREFKLNQLDEGEFFYHENENLYLSGRLSTNKKHIFLDFNFEEKANNKMKCNGQLKGTNIDEYLVGDVYCLEKDEKLDVRGFMTFLRTPRL